MEHHVRQMIELQYLETSRHTAWKVSHRMHTAAARNMADDARKQDWHLWRIALINLESGATVGYIAQEYTAPVYSAELTPVGEQLVIPGCERNLAPAAKQLSLFG